ncbi:class I SAM-dependent methyltransferase [Streptomyces sp. CA-251387]|uniref:class I SAM-dependent methyltransferase n=1 Tax=Streptomyces sp. CA-251387 TaxID=3240064 RepID=UPI003D8A56AA
MDRDIRKVDDVLRLLDGLFAPESDSLTNDAAAWWDSVYADRSSAVPFFAPKPDENLVSYAERGLLGTGRALDLGCGAGRNALYLASLGFDVDAVDLSSAAVAWAEERARDAGAKIRFVCGDALAPADGELDGPYDLIYDSSCFHHLPPHRRISYLAFLERVLAPGGHLALTCFAGGGMGSELSDTDFYRQSGLRGGVFHAGLAYTPESLRWVFCDLTEVEVRRMSKEPPQSPWFGEPFLWTALFRRDQP